MWLATLLWTFGFDTVYAMADRDDDRAIGVRSSALSLGSLAPLAVAISYGLAALALGLAAGLQGSVLYMINHGISTGVAGAARLRVVIEHRVDDDAARTFTAMNHVGHGESVGIK